ncbi:hypothetical protein P170DRAFT_425829 [Aspergillus steynii IBT 23096]|uniref:DUF7770 domain-containing protein n=1 Tax=Aspergillus steynii IBT 23096 TaxID=1392250 RepID=A0A2I2G7H6_9EURO|nr:uncharacterized protein P170DRAFT_425829 [Aspergillus steynii IBT 23096]PLB48821.1 hypothetical protein P170DRAFT_425829 [Aspergillus steynii IBT 23096]
MAPKLPPQTVQTDASPVVHVRLVVHTLGPASPNTSDNHWSIYLIHPNGVSSTRINMRAEFDDPHEILEWTKHDYIHTTSAIACWDIPVSAGITVASIARLVYGLGRDRYTMSGGGSGCRWWVYTIVHDLARERYVNQDAPSQIWPHLLYLYHTQKERRQLHMIQGEFY